MRNAIVAVMASAMCACGGEAPDRFVQVAQESTAGKGDVMSTAAPAAAAAARTVLRDSCREPTSECHDHPNLEGVVYTRMRGPKSRTNNWCANFWYLGEPDQCEELPVCAERNHFTIGWTRCRRLAWAPGTTYQRINEKRSREGNCVMKKTFVYYPSWYRCQTYRRGTIKATLETPYLW